MQIYPNTYAQAQGPHQQLHPPAKQKMAIMRQSYDKNNKSAPSDGHHGIANMNSRRQSKNVHSTNPARESKQRSTVYPHVDSKFALSSPVSSNQVFVVPNITTLPEVSQQDAIRLGS